MTLEPGIRVVRGPDWKWEDQDGGLGHLGTIVPSEMRSPDMQSVEVRWDRGLRGDYRIGYQDAYDLRLFDNGTVGVKHSDVGCDVCQKSPIYGIRWRSRNIENYNLCSSCYHGRKANPGHRFYRIVVPGAKGVLMEKRSSSEQVEVKGLFPGAKVIVGSDLKVTDNDDRIGYKGTLKKLEAWEQGYPNTGAVVNWPPFGMSRYRVGYKGKMDLKTKDPRSGGLYYLSHLPVLGQPVEMEVVDDLTVGDHVIIEMEEGILRRLQEGHGEWVPEMAHVIGEVGVVRDVTSSKDLKVEFLKSCKKWIFHSAALKKVSKYELPTIQEVNESGDFRIEVDKSGQNFGAMPKLSQGRTGTSTVAPGTTDQKETIRIREVSMRVGLEKSKDMKDVAIAAAQGNGQMVREILQGHPDWVNTPCDEKSLLQLAVHGGFMEVAKILIEAGADLEFTDEDGDTALMFAVYGNHPEIVQYLLSKGANVNAVNDERRSALHQAITRGFIECIKVLLDYNCSMNIQDNFGDTALHDAINVQSKPVLALLFEKGGMDFQLVNKRQFNALQWAALKGNQYAVQRMLSKEPRLARIRNVDGQTALHIAARNNFPDIVRLLIVKGECSVNEYTVDRQTPLLLAVRAGHVEVIEALLNLQADVNMPDDDGDTSLHVALLRQVIFPHITKTIFLEKIQNRIPDQSVATSGLALACLLVEYKGDLEHVNNKGQTPLDIVPDANVHAVLRHFVPITGSFPGAPNKESLQPESSLHTNLLGTLPNEDETEIMRRQREKIAYYERQVQAPDAMHGGDNRFEDHGPSGSRCGERREVTDAAGDRMEPETKGSGVQGRSEHVRMQEEKERQCRLAPSWTHPWTEGEAKVKIDSHRNVDGDHTPPHIAKQRMEERLIREQLVAAAQGEKLREYAGHSTDVAASVRAKTPEHILKQQMEEMKLQDEALCRNVDPGNSASLRPGDNRDNVPKHIAMQAAKEQRFSPDRLAQPQESPGVPSPIFHGKTPGQNNLDPTAMQAAKEHQFAPAGPASPQDLPEARTPHRPHPLDLSPQRHTPQRLISTEATPSPISIQSTPTPTTLPPNIDRCQLGGCRNLADAQFNPCGHTLVCHKCSDCFKICHQCRTPIESISRLSRAFPAFANTNPGMESQTPTTSAIAPEGGVGDTTGHPPGARRKILDSDSELTKSVLIQKNRKLEEELVCLICMERKREVVFMCGHQMCKECTEQLEECPFCRSPIIKKIKMY